MTPGPEGVCAVVINRDGLAFLPACLDSLKASTLAPSRIIVADHCSSDGSAAWVRGRAGVELVAVAGGGGPAAARNAGLEAADRDLVLLLDCDGRVEPDAISLMVRKMAALPEAAVVCPVVAVEGTRLIQHGPADCHILGLSSFEGWWTQDPPAAEWGARRLSSAGGTALLVHKGRIPADMRFDERFGYSCEDADFALRVAASGRDVVCEPAAVVRHANPRLAMEAAGRVAYAPEKLALQSRNRRWLMLKTFSLRTLFLTAPLQALFEFGTAAFALSEGLPGAYLSGWASFFQGLPYVLRQRKLVQAAKAVDDRVLLTARRLSLRPSVGQRPDVSAAASVWDRACLAWWRMAGGTG